MPGNFGPASDLPLDSAHAFRVALPPKGRLHFRFNFNAHNENAVIIYTADTLEWVTTRGNYHRYDWDFILPGANLGVDEHFLITGWHKDGPPDGGKPWFQSRMKIFFDTSTVASVGFEDEGGDADFDDAVVRVNFTPLKYPSLSTRSLVYAVSALCFAGGVLFAAGALRRSGPLLLVGGGLGFLAASELEKSARRFLRPAPDDPSRADA